MSSAIPDQATPNDNGGSEQEVNDDGAPPVQEPRRYYSQHSSYRLSKDSDHVRGNLLDEDGGEPFGDAPHYDPLCDHKQFQFIPRLKFGSPE
ncbi:unnamed protein product [Linum trigynum]|uniref:Uncharacterized protein n=1 Tax=Linum trigynum TaxID=586398 RepID=A0AAV2F5F8_9ROSI